jgi:hypothetical protein
MWRLRGIRQPESMRDGDAVDVQISRIWAPVVELVGTARSQSGGYPHLVQPASVRECALDLDEGSSARAGRPARRIPDHPLEGWVETRPVVVRAQVTPPDPLVDGVCPAA